MKQVVNHWLSGKRSRGLNSAVGTTLGDLYLLVAVAAVSTGAVSAEASASTLSLYLWLRVIGALMAR
jgi:hypothetical protein